MGNVFCFIIIIISNLAFLINIRIAGPVIRINRYQVIIGGEEIANKIIVIIIIRRLLRKSLLWGLIIFIRQSYDVDNSRVSECRFLSFDIGCFLDEIFNSDRTGGCFIDLGIGDVRTAHAGRET